ncbi:MAG: hypothetical protein KC503_07965 [Myxococcales bacterium]|nr:hypothetical protein [Myxococcales bacterium]
MIALAPPAPRWVREQPIAHRGLHDAQRPENSLAAFEAAARAGYAIELDVQLLADGGIAVFHDDTLERMTGARGPIHALRRAELAPLRLAASDQHVPLLDEVLELVAGRAPLLVEIKNRGAVGALERGVASALVRYGGEAAVQSFNPLSMAALAREAPQIARGQLSGSFFDEPDLALYKKALLRRLMLCPVSRPSFIGYELSMLPYWAVTVWRRALSLPLLAWTVRSEADLRRARALVDNVIFENVRP